MSKPKSAKNIQIPDQVLRELLTASEWRMLKNRWQILNLLRTGLSVRKIAEEVKVGTDTVVRTSRIYERASLKDVLDSNHKEENIKSQTPWIFGKK